MLLKNLWLPNTDEESVTKKWYNLIDILVFLFLGQIIQRFQIRVSPLTADVKAKTHGLLCPATAIHLQFIDREN